jgi:hypothetical protein
MIEKRRAIEARRSIVACAREYFAAHGAPANLTGFIERLRSEGVLTKTRFGKKYPMWWRRSKLFRAVARENK